MPSTVIVAQNTVSSVGASVTALPFVVPDIEALQTCHGVEVDVLRLDKCSDLASGNKWFKLRCNIDAAEAAGAKTLVSFGGAYSNHIHALAAAAKYLGWAVEVFLRFDADAAWTPTMQDAAQWGMRFHYLSRSDYRRRHDAEYVAELLGAIDRPYLIPEGGANDLGARGAAGIVDYIPQRGADYQAVLVACGTGCTLAGISSAVADGVAVIGVPVLKAEKFMAADISLLLAKLGGDRGNWYLDHRFHGGGYARLSTELELFIRNFEAENTLLLDPVYTAKLFYATQEMVASGDISAGSRILLVHSGGLQGRRGFPQLYSA